MKLFDVMVYDTKRMQDVLYRASLVKRDAKKLMKDLQKKGFKSQVLTARPNRIESEIRIEQATQDNFEND